MLVRSMKRSTRGIYGGTEENPGESERESERESLERMHLRTTKKIQLDFVPGITLDLGAWQQSVKTHNSWSQWWCSFGGRRRRLFRNAKTLGSSSS